MRRIKHITQYERVSIPEVQNLQALQNFAASELKSENKAVREKRAWNAGKHIPSSALKMNLKK